MNTGSDTALLAVSFGTSYNDSCAVTIGATESAIREAFPDIPVIRAFTSGMIIKKIARRDGFLINDVDAALEEAIEKGASRVVVQPTHLMDGHEYHDILEDAEKYRDRFEKIVFGEPLLSSDGDFNRVIKAITDDTASYCDGETAIVFMGHGTDAEANAVYEKLQAMLNEAGFDNYYIGTVEASPTIDDMISAVKQGDYKRVLLQPLMMVSGDHANNDMAGDEEDSWKSLFEKEGYRVECILKGMGEMPAIRDIYVDHAKEAYGKL